MATDDETQLDLPGLDSAPEPPNRAHQGKARRGRMGVALAGVAVALIVALFAVLALQRGDSGAGAPPPVVPSSWQTYHDPAGMFSVRVPDGWAVRLDTSPATYGDRTGSATVTDEMLSIGDPEQGSATAHFDVYASPINTAFERHWYCQAFPGANGAFHGLPTTLTDQTMPMWLFDTANAHFQVSVWIPGVLEPPHSEPARVAAMPTATPLPAATVAVDRHVLATILGSFTPTNPHALAC